MSAFVDTMLIRLADPARLHEVVAPAADASHRRIKQLFAAVYTLPYAAIHDVTAVDVLASEFQRPLFPPRRLAGTWTQTTPNHVRTDVLYEGRDGLAPEWLDVMTHLAVTVLLEIDAGEVESIQLGDIGDFDTFAEFEAKFRYFDLDAFLARHHITTVEELKQAYRYLLGEIRLKHPATVSPGDPANERRFPLGLAILIRDTVDVVAGLRDARLARELCERTLAYQPTAGEAEVRTPYAPVLLMPEAAVAATGFSADDLATFFAAQDVLAVFTAP